MTKPIIRIHNIETDEVIDQEMNEEEYAQYLADREYYENRLEIEQNKTQMRASALAKLAALGLTEEEIAAL
jgi:hypothetical protein